MKLFMKIAIVSLSLAALAGLISAGCAAVRAGYESAPYKVVKRDGHFELRDYPPLVIAETPMRGADGSFMRLFHFIDGKNAAQQKIPMTTPVFFSGEATNATMAFVLPKDMATNQAPKPNEPSVVIREIPGGQFAVLRFSGGRNADNETNTLEQLKTWMAAHKLSPVGPPIYAYFDPPWTPTFFRRNEVMLRVGTP
jgi:DNA gyrase inhibitor GyrI